MSLSAWNRLTPNDDKSIRIRDVTQYDTSRRIILLCHVPQVLLLCSIAALDNNLCVYLIVPALELFAGPSNKEIPRWLFHEHELCFYYAQK